MEGYQDSLGEVRAALSVATERVQAAYRCVTTARQRLGEAVALLTELDRAHHEKLVPPELLGADQELARGLGLIIGAADSVASIESRL